MAGTGNSGGRNKKTQAMHLVDGTFRKDRHADASPEPTMGKPVAPKALAGDALAEWDRMLVRLEECRTLSVVDDGALYQYCCMFSETEDVAVRREHTEGLIDRLDDLLTKLDGSDLAKAIENVVKLKALESRYIAQIRQGRMALRAFLVEFGLTPAARGRVKVIASEKPVVSALDRIIGRKRG